MSTCSDAHLYYGVDIFNPEVDFEAPNWGAIDIDDDGDKIDLLYEVEGWLKANCPEVKIFTHCHIDFPVYALYSKKFFAFRGYPKLVDSLAVPEGSDDKIRKVLDILGKGSLVDKIGWYLASDSDF